MRINVGTSDRMARLIFGLLLVVAPFATNLGLWANSAWTWTSVAVGAVLLFTGIVRFCPAYAPLGLSTCKVRAQ
ncbi:MAG: YgaP family membrane protein [Devosia sp.]